MLQKIYRVCPSGKSTLSVNRYMREWYEVIRPLEKKMDMKIHSFDPDIRLSSKKGYSFNFPIWLVEKLLNKKIKEIK
jgi:hypothetical protein